MLPKDFENYELRLKKLREKSLEFLQRAEKYFSEQYEAHLREIFPRDILGIKKEIAGVFVTSYAESLRDKQNLSPHDIFKRSTEYALDKIPLTSERRERLFKNIIFLGKISESQQQLFSRRDDISRDPFFALIEDFSLDGEISKEEFLLLQENFEKQENFISALESLPENIKKMFFSHISLALEGNSSEKQSSFESEYSSEISVLKNKGFNIDPVMRFAARFYYKTPGKYRKYEHPKRRLRRTMKLALLKLLRIKLGNIDAENILQKFEQGESFDDYFMILYKLLDVLDENPQSEEIYSILKIEDELKSDVISAEENKQKIMQGDFLITKIANLFSKSEASSEQQELESGMLEKLLDESTDIVGEDVYFNREIENVGVYAQADTSLDESDDEEDFDSMSPEVAYEILKKRFHDLEEKKRNAFLSGEYEKVDEINEGLLDIDIKLSKLVKILGVGE